MLMTPNVRHERWTKGREAAFGTSAREGLGDAVPPALFRLLVGLEQGQRESRVCWRRLI